MSQPEFKPAELAALVQRGLTAEVAKEFDGERPQAVRAISDLAEHLGKLGFPLVSHVENREYALWWIPYRVRALDEEAPRTYRFVLHVPECQPVTWDSFEPMAWIGPRLNAYGRTIFEHRVDCYFVHFLELLPALLGEMGNSVQNARRGLEFLRQVERRSG